MTLSLACHMGTSDAKTAMGTHALCGRQGCACNCHGRGIHIAEHQMTNHPDAQTWAQQFIRTIVEHPEIDVLDEGWLIGWFANAMQAREIHLRKDETAAKIAALDLHPYTAANSGVGMIAAERRRQIDGEGYTPAHDASHDHGELIAAAEAHLVGDPALWPWDSASFKRSPRMQGLIKAGALIAAEIDRLTAAEQNGDADAG